MSTREVATTPARTDAPTAHVATPKEDLITIILGAMFVSGAATDIWAHSNLLSEVQEEGFFTLWHGMLYAGFAATAAWTLFLAYQRRDRSPRWWVDGFPAGYRIGAVGAGIFLLGGLGDMVWHTIFGIEATLDAILSPSHLLLGIGGALLLTSPARSWWHTGDGGLRTATGVLSLALATATTSVFFSYANAFTDGQAVLPFSGDPGSPDYAAAVRGVAAYLVTMALLTAPLLLAYRRRTAPGLATALVGVVALFWMTAREFAAPLAAAAVAAVVAAALVDVLLVRLDRARGLDAPARAPLAGGLFAGVVTSAHLLGLHLDAGIRWPAELWTGTIVTATVIGIVLGLLADRPRHSWAGR